MTTRPEDVIKSVAVENGIGLVKEDALMALVTVMNRITEDQLKGVEAALEHHRGLLEEMSATWREDSVKSANLVLNAALESGREAISKGMSEGAARVTTIIRDEHQRILTDIQEATDSAIRDFRRLLLWALTGSGIFFLSLLIFTGLR